jgi:hypothetical protein
MKHVLIALLALAPAYVQAQSLGEAAAKEKERRKEQETKEKQKPRTYSNDDLGPEQKDKKAPLNGTEAGPATIEHLEGTPPGKVAEEKGWRSRAESARSAVKKAQERVESLDAQAKQLLNQRLLSTDTNEILRLQAEQKGVLDQIEVAKQEVEAAQKAFQDFEDAARAAHVPQQWLDPPPES